MKNKLLLLVAMFFSFLNPVAHADTASAVHMNNGLSIGIGTSHLAYGETQDGTAGYLDTENGNLASFMIEYNLMKNGLGLSNLYAHFQVAYSHGNTTYDGTAVNLSTGAKVPYSSATGTSLLSSRIGFGKAFTVFNGFLLTPHIDAGYRIWNRELNNGVPPGYGELYRHWFYGAGMKADYSPLRQVTFTIDGAVRRNAGSAMTADIDPDTFTLGNGTSVYLSGRVNYALNHRISLFVQSNLERFTYGHSNVHPATGFQEPDSRTQQNDYLGGVTFLF